MPMLYNAEGQEMGMIGDNDVVPLGRWIRNVQGNLAQGNGQTLASALSGGVVNIGAANGSSGVNTTGASAGGGTNWLGLTGSGGTGTGTGAGAGAPTTGTGTGTPTTGTPATGTGTTSTAKPTYSQVYSAYLQANPGKTPTGAEFNEWAGANGFSSWDPDPAGTPAPGTPGGVGGAAVNSTSSGTSNQTGTFNTNNTTAGTQNQTTGGTNTQNTTGTTSQTGTNTQAVTGTNTTAGANTSTSSTAGTNTQTGGSTANTLGSTTNTGTSTTGVQDTLGFGQLLKGQVGTTQANDATRNAFLTDVVNTGGQQFGSQVDQAVRNAISGPQMTGAGDSARARAAGYAGAQVGRQNLDQRLGAAQALSGPTGLQSLVASGNPYLGQTTSGTNTGTTNTSQTGTNFLNAANTALTNASGTNTQTGSNAQTSTGSNTSAGTTAGTSTGSTTGFQNLVSAGSENTQGTANSTGAQQASGLSPEAKQVSSGGGCVICTAGLHHGVFTTPRVLRHVVKHKLQRDWSRFRYAARGYFFLFTPIARFLLAYPYLTLLCMPVAKAVVYEEVRISGKRLPFRLLPWLYHWSWHLGCALVGRFPVSEVVTDEKVLATAKRHGVLFQVGGESNVGGNKK